MEKESLRGAVALSHFFLRERVERGDRVVDATCGNGHDTLFLARLVGQEGIRSGRTASSIALHPRRTLCL